MYPTSSSSHSSQTFHNELKGRYGNGEERYLTEYPKYSHSSSAIFSSPAMHSRSRPSHRPSSSRSASHQHSRSLQYSPPNFDYSHGSYDRRSSSPLTSASSPPPMTSPLIAPIRIHANYEPKVRIVGRDREESYHFCDSEYDSDFSRFSRRNDEDNWRPSLPSFKSLFGSGEHHKDPSPKITLSPLNFPLPPIRAQHRRAVSSVHALAGVEACAATNLSDAADPQCLQLHVQQSRANDRAVLSDPDHTIHSGEQQCQSNPAFPAYPVKISHQAPHRQKLLFSDADPTPDTPEERGTKFLSPVKGSPYPRRTYFLVSSERGRRSPEPNTTRCGLYQLAEIAEKARSDLPECTALEVVPEPTEESIIYSASSPFSSPVGYQSSLPPSSPPTSEAQLSPMLPEKELSEPTTLPLADVKNLTFSASDRIESHKPSKPIVAATSHLGDNGEKDTQEMKSPMTVVLIQDLNSNVVNNESPSHGLSTATLYGNIDADMESKQTLDMVESAPESLLLQSASSDEVTVAEKAVDCNSKSTTGDDQQSLDFARVEPVLPDTHSDASIHTPTVSSVHALTSRASAETPSSTVSSSKSLVKQLSTKTNNKTKSKSSSAPSIASSAPRVTVTVVKRMKPALNAQRGAPRPLSAKGAPMSGQGKDKDVSASVSAKGKGNDKDILKTKTSEVVNSHSLPPKRLRENDVSSKDIKGLDVPPKKKVKITSEETTSSSSSLAKAISSSYETSSISSVSQTSTVPAKRKADDEASSRLAQPASKSSVPPPALVPSPSKTPKKQKVMVLELPVYTKRKPENSPVPPRIQPSPSFPQESDSTTWVDEHWADALAAAYGAPGHGAGLSASPKPPTPKHTVVIADPMSESDLTSDEDDEEEEQRTEPKIKSPRSTKRMIIESDSEEEDDSEMEEKVITRPRPSRRRIVDDTSDSEVEDDDDSEEGEDDNEATSSDEEQKHSTGKTKHSTKSYSKPKTLFPPPSPLDLELVGIIIETMTLTRSSSHLASALYRTVRETRGGVFAKILKANSAHFDAVTEKLRSQGLNGQVSEDHKEQTSRRGRPRRGAAVNDEGGVAGMSEEDIMWVSEFERIMAESATRCGMFGKVESSFRNDPRDLPLPFSSRFFYVPECDPDTERAQLVRLTMPGSGKRSETMKYKQYYWKPVGK